jgi:hydroxyacylglutathione hydrolase
MAHVVSQPTPAFLAMDGRLEVHQIPAAEDNLIWLLVCVETGAVAAVDGPGAGEVLRFCEERGLVWNTIINTHTHGDHIGINRDLERRGMLADFRVVGSAAVADAVPGITEPVGEGDSVTLGAVTGRVLLTEGHLDGHISFLFGDVLFCGDTLFGGGCGYLFDGPPAKMFRSLSRLAELPGETRVCCAHEYTQDNLRFAWSVEPDNEALQDRIRDVWAARARGESTVPSRIADERATNPFLRPGSPSLQASVQTAWGERPIATWTEWFAATRELKDRKDYREQPLSSLPTGDQ